jgi:hypothetical protein
VLLYSPQAVHSVHRYQQVFMQAELMVIWGEYTARVCVCVWAGTYVHRLICSFVCRCVSIYTYLCQVHGRDSITLWWKDAVSWSMSLKLVSSLQHLQHCVTGASEETGQLALGICQGSRHVRKLSSVKHNYPDHVVKAAEVGSWQTVHVAWMFCICCNFVDTLCSARFWVPTVVLLRSQVFHDLTLCCLLGVWLGWSVMYVFRV